MASSAVGYAGFIAAAAIIGLLAAEITGRDLLAGVPAAAGTLGTAAAASSLALRSRRLGRRRGLTFGYLVAIVGTVVAIVAGQLQLFWLLVAAMAVFGFANASNLQARFAAADLADDEKRARAIAMVVWVGTIGAILGPTAAPWANRLGVGMGMEEWVSPLFLSVAGFGLAAAITTAFLRPDPLQLAGGVDPETPFENPLRGLRHSWLAIWPRPQARLAVLAMAVSQMAMVAVMTMTPLHMRDHGHAELSTLVISVHVLGMFGLSPLVGRWADRFGRVRVLGIGAIILASGTISAVAAGYVPALVFAGLFLLGLGWSFALISGSALLTECLPVEERVGAQGLADVAMSVLGATAAFSSGFVKEMVGYHWLANFATVAAILTLVAVGTVHRSRARVAV
ncbi:MAG TPA: MFS transporter [Acidimicrobiia bacterium]